MMMLETLSVAIIGVNTGLTQNSRTWCGHRGHGPICWHQPCQCCGFVEHWRGEQDACSHQANCVRQKQGVVVEGLTSGA